MTPPSPELPALRFPCPACGAPAGERCRAMFCPPGIEPPEITPHVARTRLVPGAAEGGAS